MWRFYVAATAIVAAFVFLATVRRATPPDLRVTGRATGTPSAARPESASSGGAGAVRGDAPWALSALPDCARQDHEARGAAGLIRAEIPADARPVAGVVRAGPCRIEPGAGGIGVTRGADRLRIPAPAQLFVVRREQGERYYLYRRLGDRAELREYTLRAVRAASGVER